MGVGEESSTPPPPGPRARGSRGPGHGRRQLSALGSSQLGRPLWVGREVFPWHCGLSGGSQAPVTHRGSVPSPEQAPWHDVVV